MKKSILFICVIIFIAIKPAHSLMSEKAGWYDVNRVMHESDITKEARTGFKNFYNEKVTMIKEVERNLTTRKDELEKQGSAMTQSSHKEKEVSYQKKLREYQQLVNDTNEELKKRDLEFTKRLIPEIMKVVERIKKEEKYTVITPIVDKSTEHPKGEDITDKVIKECNLYAKTNVTPVVVSSTPATSSDIDKVPLVNAKQNPNNYAIVIGIENYRQKLPKADFATADAMLMSEYLTKVMGYPENNIVTLLNERAAKSDLEKYLGTWLTNNVENETTVFIYYSGHGAPNPKTGDAYLVPYDGDPAFIADTGYPLKRLYAQLGKLPVKQVIIALDSCFSGAGGRSVIAKGARPLVMNLQTNTALPDKITVLSASSSEQISSTYDEKGHGLFTYFMLKGIKDEDVIQPDGSIKMEELFGYIKPQVERIARKQFNNEQTPQLIGAKKN